MASLREYSIREERTSWKSLDLIYEEPGRKLVVYVEVSGVPHFDRVGVDTALEAWTDPAGEPIPEGKRREIVGRVADWCKEKRIRIDFGSPIDMEAHLEELRQAGWSIERHADGRISATPPSRTRP